MTIVLLRAGREHLLVPLWKMAMQGISVDYRRLLNSMKRDPLVMRQSLALRVAPLFLLVLMALIPAPAARAFTSVGVRAGYETDPGAASDSESGDAWAEVTAGKILTRETGGPLSFSVDLSLGATGYARLTELDRISLVVAPTVDYVLSQKISAFVGVFCEGQLVKDDDQNAWGWGANLQLREQLSARVRLAEYIAYSNMEARDPEYSGTNAAAGMLLETFIGERWTLGIGGEYAHGDFLSGRSRGSGAVWIGTPAGTGTGSGPGAGTGEGTGSALGSSAGAGSGSGVGIHKSEDSGQDAATASAEDLVGDDEDRVSGYLSLSYSWSGRVSSGAEYVYTRASGSDADEARHSFIVSTTFGF